MSTSISIRTSTLALFALCAAALSAPVGCAPVDDVTDETGVAVGELASGTLTGMVIAYAPTNGSNLGPHQSFGPGVYTAAAGELAAVGNDLTRLLEIAPAVRVRVCQNDTPSFSTCVTYENLTGSNKRVSIVAGTSRLEVRPLVVGYRDANYGGVAQGFEIGRYDSLDRIWTVGNDTITSVRFAPGLRATLCSDDPLRTVGGTCRTYTGSVTQLPSGLDNNTSWLDVVPVTTGFQNASFTGASQGFSGGVYPVSALSVLGNDTLSSIAVPEGVITRACSDDPTNTIGYTCVTFSKSSLQVPAALDNRTSWMDSSQNVILSPLNEEAVYASSVTLRGYAISPAGQQIAGTSLRWYSNYDGFLGTGQTLTVPLSTVACGTREHVITLISTDAQGRTLTTQRRVTTNIIC